MFLYVFQKRKAYFVHVCLYLTDMLNVQCHTHESTSRLTATVSWTYQSNQIVVHSWHLRLRNLTWEQNDYVCPGETKEFDGGALTWLLIL